MGEIIQATKLFLVGKVSIVNQLFSLRIESFQCDVLQKLKFLGCFQ